jgi:hypothetical protein
MHAPSQLLAGCNSRKHPSQLVARYNSVNSMRASLLSSTCSVHEGSGGGSNRLLHFGSP